MAQAKQLTPEQKRVKVIKASNNYADIAVKEGTAVATKRFYSDYLKGIWNLIEHLAIMCLVRQYIDCKNGKITRDECLKKQGEILDKIMEE